LLSQVVVQVVIVALVVVVLVDIVHLWLVNQLAVVGL
jgi:hypothetical protein